MSSNRTRVLAGTAGVLALVACGARLGAQSDSAPAAIPAPLATALIAGGGAVPATQTARYVVAALPSGWPAELVPPSPTTVLGGMTSGSMLVAVFADSTQRLLANYVGLIEGAGFHKPPPPTTSGFETGGYDHTFFCRDSATVFVTSVPGPLRSAVHVTYRPRNAVSCNAQPAPPPEMETLALPSLAPPPGAHSDRGGSSADSRRMSAETQLIGAALDPAAVVAHYATQLSAAGWTTSPAAANPRVAVQPFQARDKSGKSWSGALVVVRSGAALDVSLMMQREEGR